MGKEVTKRKILILNLIMLLLLVVIGLTYAYFNAQIIEGETIITADSGSMIIKYDGGPDMVIGAINPSELPFATKTFTVTGNSLIEATMDYNVSIVMSSNTFTDYGLSYKLTSSNTGSNGTIIPSTTYDMCFFMTGPTETVLGNGLFSGPTNGEKVHTYTLDLYFPTSIDQSYNLGKSFQFKIKIEAGTKTVSVCDSEPYIDTSLLRNKILADYGGTSNITEAPAGTFDNISGATDNIMYKMADNYGTSYYYRGAKDYVNNNLIFAGYQWKIVRINGNGSVRIIYNGICPNNDCINNFYSTGIDTHILRTPFNNYADDTKYVGYMYGGAEGVASTSYIQATTNTTDSNVKTYLDTWYANNLSNSIYEQYISDTLFCNDRTIYGVGLGYGANATTYASYNRVKNNKVPSLMCSNQNDRFTTTSYYNPLVSGNNKLIYPVGLITADEITMAGLIYGELNLNTTNYFFTAQSYWTMSPDYYGNNAYESFVYSSGRLWSNTLTNNSGVRPVINLVPNAPVTGTGSVSNPYIVG